MDVNDDTCSSGVSMRAAGCFCNMMYFAEMALEGLGQAWRARELLAANWVAISRPRPMLAPVTMATFPERSGMSLTVHLAFIKYYALQGTTRR